MNDSQPYVGEVNKHILEIDNSREMWLRNGFVNMHYLDGKHRVYYDVRTRSVITKELDENEIRTEVAFMRKQLRGLINMLTKNDFKVTVKNSPSNAGTVDERRVARHILRNTINSDVFKEKVKDLLQHGFVKTWGLISVLPSKDIETSGKFDFDVYDPFDVYPDNKQYVEDWNFLILTKVKTLKELQSDPLYADKDNKYRANLETLSPDGKVANNNYKDQFLKTYGNKQNNLEDSCILKQYFFIDSDKEGNSVIHLIAIAGEILIRDIILPPMYKNLADIFTKFTPERRPDMLYNRAWMSELQAINKSMDRNITNLETYDHFFSKGRYLREVNTNIKSMINENGQEIVYDGIKPEFQGAQPLNAGSFELFNLTARVGEDVGGIHSDSLGRVSGGAASGIAIRYLQATDLNNIAEPVSEMKIAMQKMARNILRTASYYYANLVKIYDRNDEEIGGAIGSETEGGRLVKTSSGVTKIKSFDNLEIDVMAGSAWNDIQAAQDILELRKNGIAIPDKWVLAAYSFGNTADIIDDMEKEKESQEEKNPDIKIADGENQKMLLGQNVTVNPSDINEIHIAIHGVLLKNLPQTNPNYPIVFKHVTEHQAVLGNSKALLEAQTMAQ